MTEYSAEVMQMARAICAECSKDAGQLGKPIAPRFLSGELDSHPAVIAAALAIVQTTEAAAAMVAICNHDMLRPKLTESPMEWGRRSASAALRAFSHLPTVAAEKGTAR